MLTNHEFRGYWWLPENEADKLTATLLIEKGKSELQTLGNFGHELLSESSREKSFALNPADQEQVHGISADGKSITLQGLSARDNTLSMPGIPTSKYVAEVALVGKHFPADQEIAFDEISIRASDLNAWTKVNGFKSNMDFEQLDDAGSLGFSAVNIRYEGPEPISIPLSRGEEISIHFTATNKGLGHGAEHVELRQDAALHLRFAKKTSLEDIYLRVGQIRNFLSFAVGRPVSVVSVAGYEGRHTGKGSDRRRPIELLWPIPHNPEPPSQRRFAREMLFALPEARPDIPTVIKKWFQRQDRLEPVFNLFFGILYHPDLYLEVRFLTFVQAIETYDHRRRPRSGKIHLARRVRDVLGGCRTVSKRVVGPGDASLDAFIKLLVDSRNYYTHYDPALDGKAAEGVSLYLLTLQLQAIIEMSLLRELGFPARAIDEILERTQRYAEIEHFRSLASSDAGE
jgi:hypothetical protein